MQDFVMLLCRLQNARLQEFVCVFCYEILKLNHFAAHAFKRTSPTHEIAVWSVISFALTCKARDSANWTLRAEISHQKQGFAP